MRKVLIADDEYLVRLGLRTMVDWASHGFIIVGEAANGREAIELFHATDPDILLTDIKMPLVDGLQLIENLKSKKPSLYVVILSNYGDFAYAQRAIELGASEYILKSDMNQDTILRTLNRMLRDMEAVEDAPLHNREPAIREYLRQALTLPRSSRPDPPPQGFPAPGRYAVLISRCDTSVLSTEAQPMFHRSSRTMLEELWPDSVIASAQSADILSVMLVAPLKSDDHLLSLRQHALRTALNIRQYFDVEFQVGISLPGGSGDLPELIQQAASAFEDCFFSSEPVCVYTPDRPSPDDQVRVNQAWMQDLVTLRDFGRLNQYIRGVFNALCRARDYALVQDAYFDFISFARQMVARYPEVKIHFGREEKLSYAGLDNLRHIDTCSSFVLDIFRIIGAALSGQGPRYSSVVSRAIEYIHAHYHENIALSDASDAVGLSKSHLSQLFKQETGINFTKYLMDYRIEQAKQLFATSNLHIYEVAERVGIPNPYYFSKVFKESTGFTCRDYRNKLYTH